MWKKASKSLSKLNKPALIVILLGAASWALTMVKSGWLYDYGIGFWGPNGHDGVWHLALIKQFAKGNFVMPVFGGVSLQNYHVGYDLLVAVLSNLTRLSPSLLYFQIIPPILAVFIGLAVYMLVHSWQKSKSMAEWALFFVFFGGGFGWIITLLRGQGAGGESLFWSQQAISTLINPPFALSLLFILVGLITISKYLSGRKVIYLFLSILLFGVLIQVKSYAGVLALGGLAVSGVWRGFTKKDWSIGLIFFGALIMSLVLFFPFNKNASGLLVWQPFWFLETMMGLSDRVGWMRYFSAMTSYRSGGMWWKAVPAYVIALIIFWYGNLGTRVIKDFRVFGWLRNVRSMDWLDVFFAAVIIAGGVIPTFFLQKGTPWNTIQFFYYSLFFSAILAGIAMPNFLRKFSVRVTRYLAAIIVVAFTLPTTIGTLKYIYLPARPPAVLPNEEFEALNFLSTQPDGVVLTYPFSRNPDVKLPEPVPLYQYVSTSYVSAFSGKQVYLEDEVNLDITGYNWKERRSQVEEFYDTLDHEYVWNFLRANNITYVYWVKGQRARLGEGQLGIERIFENSKVDIYKVI